MKEKEYILKLLNENIDFHNRNVVMRTILEKHGLMEEVSELEKDWHIDKPCPCEDGIDSKDNEWHKVADGDLPKGNCENILLYNKDHFCVTHSYSLGYYENGVFYNDCEMEEDTIAWCEIPQYEEE